MTTTSSEQIDLAASLEIIEVKPGVRFTRQLLIDMLPDAETVLFFGKVFELDYVQLSNVMSICLHSVLADELMRGDHSTDLQGYIVDELNIPATVKGTVTFSPTVPTGEILPEVWRSLEVEVASSIQTVAAKLQSVVGLMPGKQGSLVMRSMMKLNRQRPTIGVHNAKIHHAPVKDNLIIFDVSGSMTQHTVETIIDDVVAMSYMANAHLAIVSNTCTHWEPGSYDVATVLRHAEFGGTQYETLAELLNRDWGVVVTIADYDSSYSAGEHIAKCRGRIDQVLDISLVNKPTFLVECVGQLADNVRPLLIGNSQYVLGSRGGW